MDDPIELHESLDDPQVQLTPFHAESATSREAAAEMDASAKGASLQRQIIDMLRCLLCSFPEGMNAGEIADILGERYNVITSQLRSLEQAGYLIVDGQFRPGTNIFVAAKRKWRGHAQQLFRLRRKDEGTSPRLDRRCFCGGKFVKRVICEDCGQPPRRKA